MDSFKASGFSQAAARQIALRAARLEHNVDKLLPGKLEPMKLRTGPTVQYYMLEGSIERRIVIVEEWVPEDRLSNFSKISKSEIVIEKSQARFKQLATVLRHLKSNQQEINNTSELAFKACMLKCLGYLEPKLTTHFSLLFEVPYLIDGEETDLNKISSLYEKLSTKTYQPTLQQKFKLARAICLSVVHLHCLGWVHKDIMPRNILLVPADSGQDDSDVGHPFQSDFAAYLCGFGIAREESGISDATTTHELCKNLYRQPERQYKPARSFTKTDDLYALGMVLLEIGLQRTVEDIFITKIVRAKETTGYEFKPETIARNIQNLAAENLPKKLGPRYAEAVRKCLTGDFGVEFDDDAKTQLSIAFQDELLEAIEYGCNL